MCAVGHVFHTKFFGRAAPFDLLRMQPIEGGRQNLFVGGVRQLVSRQLPRDEILVRHVLIEGFDDPVTIWPD